MEKSLEKNKKIYNDYIYNNVRKVDINKYKYNKSTKKKNLVIYLFLIILLIFCIKKINNKKNINILNENNDKEYDYIVCIDPGHGGNDSGSILKKRYEKDDALNVSRKVKENLEKNNIKVIMTRNDDNYISLEDRTKKANDEKCDAFISIHRNSSDYGNGIETWIMNNQNDAYILADNIINEIGKIEKQTIRGIKVGSCSNEAEDYYVNKYTKMPSCIIELGFVSSKEDNKLFDEYIDEYSNAISSGIINSLNRYKENKN